MASTADESDNYIPSNDSEVSLDSDEDERPNRWRGPKSTWRALNSEEIATATALKEIEDRDLSVHLYNAFALKQRYRRAKEGVALDGPVAGKDFNAATGEIVQQDDWLPQRSWTAWPLRADKVPPLQDSRLNDPDERFTLRKPVREMPSSALEEIISAEILKTAREKFTARPWAKAPAPDEEADDESDEDDEDELWDGETVGSTSASGMSGSRSKSRSRSRSKSVKYEMASGDEKMEVDERPPEERLQDEAIKKPRLKPAISTDDDLSYSLLRPSVRHILAQLDATLMVLHNVQESTLNCQSDSSNSEASDSSRRSSRRRSRQRSQTPASGVKKRGRPTGSVSRTRSRGRSRSLARTPPTEGGPSANEGEGGPPKKRTGRPRKTYPRLDGETDKQYATRLARLHKKPLPIFSDSDREPEPASDLERGRESGNSGDGEETAGPSAPRPRRRKRKLPAENPEKAPRAPSQAPSVSEGGGRNKNYTRPPRLGLRDWRDVLGAAALSGFPPAALDRAARRCADLFAQSMALHTLPEGPASTSSARKGPPGRETVYEPGMPYPPLLEEDVDEDGGGEGPRMTLPVRTRAASTAPSDDEPGPSQRQSQRLAQRRSGSSRPPARSRSRSAPGAFVCAVRDCPRAADGEGFARRSNLLRHLKLVHGWAGAATEGPGLGGEEGAMVFSADEVDSEDEMCGAVHVDGFLRPIRMRPGWRAADSGGRTRRAGSVYAKGRGRSRGRGGSEADDDGEGEGDGDVRMGGSGYDK
ncbi:RNA polymerase I-specific transcription initiation factor-domain-containing protein [Annulohypoxylon bovei var. microspora]|nr:RNA polymerase I-specific transcription initiation factor-domain-containing protein [Annulohypoxylon bovei var. microspora]